MLSSTLAGALLFATGWKGTFFDLYGVECQTFADVGGD
jgi:hypothetical protein